MSVINQPYDHISIILVDDGSKDGSGGLCDNLAAKYSNILVIHKANSGVSSARNVGIEYALEHLKTDENTYIAFLDADDAWSGEFLDDEIRNLIAFEYDLIGFQSCNCNEDLTCYQNPIMLEEGVYPGGTNAVWLHSSQHFGAMLYRAELLQKYFIRFYPLPASEDKMFSMHCMYLADSICLYNKKMYLYRKSHASAVHTRKCGIPYYEPILVGYMAVDVDCEKWNTEQRGRMCEGSKAAAFYLHDMICEHFKYGGSYRGMYRWLDVHPVLSQKKEPNELLAQYTVFKIVKLRLQGILSGMARYIYHIRWVQRIVDRKRYPLMVETTAKR